MGTLRSRFTVLSSSIALLALCIHCGGESGSLFGAEQGCPTSIADRCGAQCTLDSDCPDGVHCGATGVCTAECAQGSTCDNGIQCSPRGRCSTDPASSLNNTPLDGGPGGGDTDAVCAATDVVLTKVKPKVLFLLDQSSSMWKYKFPDGSSVVDGVECKNGCRWTELKKVLIGPNLATGGILKKLEGEAELGVQLYSASDNNLPDDGSYLPPSPPPAAVCPRFNGKAFNGTTFALNNATAIDALLRPATVDDDTPTGPAIRAVVGLALNGTVTDPKGFAADKSDAPKVMVLVTDGEPAICGSSNASDEGKALVISAVQQTFAQKIKTFVIAIGSGSAAANAHFKAVANAGQGKNPTTGDAQAIKPSTPQALVDALTKVVLDARTCTFKLNGEIPAGQEKLGTVTLNGTVLPFDEAGAPDEGWRVVDKSNVELVGAACTTLKTTPDAKLSASFPCGVVQPLTPR